MWKSALPDTPYVRDFDAANVLGASLYLWDGGIWSIVTCTICHTVLFIIAFSSRCVLGKLYGYESYNWWQHAEFVFVHVARSTFGDRSFAVASLRVWNSLPSHLWQDVSCGYFRRVSAWVWTDDDALWLPAYLGLRNTLTYLLAYLLTYLQFISLCLCFKRQVQNVDWYRNCCVQFCKTSLSSGGRSRHGCYEFCNVCILPDLLRL